MTQPIAQPTALSRRAVLTGSTATAATLVAIAGRPAHAGDTPSAGATEPFDYRTTRTEAEWRTLLTEDEFTVMREGGTEFPTTSPYWNTNDPGVYHCKGCAQALYSSDWYSPQEIGFVFFNHSVPNAVLTGIHESDYNGALPEPKTFLEVHCSGCGSHLGHVVVIGGEALHCINGTALELKA